MTHMAIGDYVYQRMFLKKLQETYPHLQIDLWYDNCVHEESGWNLRRSQTLTEWFKEEPFLHNLYPVAASPEEREALITRAQKESYDIIVFSVDVWSEYYAAVARKISQKAYVVGTLIKWKRNFFQKFLAFSRCNKFFIPRYSSKKNKNGHITEMYQKRFERLVGLKTTLDEIKPHLTVPNYWQERMQVWLAEEKVKHQALQDTILINYLSTNEQRNWSFEQARDLIIALNKRHPRWTYVLTLAPQVLPEVLPKLNDTTLQGIHVIPFSAEENFYQLPALVQQCNCVISVETALMHLASALSVPQIALVRGQARIWAPLANEKTHILFTKERHSPISQITVNEVMECYNLRIYNNCMKIL